VLILNPPSLPPSLPDSKSTCPFCKKAKATLLSEGAKFEVIELDQRDDGPAIQAALAALTWVVLASLDSLSMFTRV
jgi:glutaredoxin